MRALRQESFGAPEVLQVVNVPDPVPLPSEVVVRVAAIGLNPVEAIVRAGYFPLIGQPPFILGWDISGVVETVVPGVTRFKVGDEVFGMPFFPRAAAGYAERVAAPSRQLVRKPDSLNHIQAAALPLAGLTAWQSLVDAAQVKKGQRVLIHGAGGGVGHLAVQIARGFGAHVLATVSEDKADFVRSLGAHELIDYKRTRFEEVARDVDIVVECIGGETATRSIATLRPGGLFVTLVGRSDRALQARVEQAGRQFIGITVEPDQVGLEHLARWVDAGRLRVHVDEVFDFEDAARAHARLDAGGIRGKLVLAMSKR
jgi:NADPH:quinone reductase-like Zn-dependent oxidoreductase